MTEADIQVLDETPEHIVLEIQELTESGAIEQAERWAKLEGVELSDVERILAPGLESATAGYLGASRSNSLRLYYHLKLSIVPGDYAPRTIKLDQVSQ